MKKISLLLVLIFLFSSCTERMTKQFITVKTESQPDTKKIENWYIEPPKLIAFKHKKVDEISNDSLIYWLTMRAFSQKNENVMNTLIIDSVGLEFTELSSIVWRSPSRIAPFEKSGKSYLAFDFFKDKGVEIPDSITNIRLFFDVLITDTDTRHKVSFEMIRQDTLQMTPFMIQ